MTQPKDTAVQVKKMIWRISVDSPLGGYVSADEAGHSAAAATRAGAVPGSRTSWKVSSVELRDGLQVSEQPLDALPGELLDELFNR
jgi:hypothetical protein